MITIINYGMGNIGSLQNMISKVGGSSMLSSDYNSILSSDKLILPGVGSFDNAVDRLHSLGLWEIINKKVVYDKVPILCICLGAQLATRRSDEGILKGFGWLDAETIKFDLSSIGLKVPHMGWNSIFINKQGKITIGLDNNASFYFVHSYYIKSLDSSIITMTAEYGHQFVAGLEKNNVFAYQFHPEKSHTYGMKLIKNFVEY